MPSNQHPFAPNPHLPLDVLLAVDVDVGWQVGLVTLPGKIPPGDSFPLTDPDNVTHVFEAEFNALMSDPEGVRVLKEAAANALMHRQVEIGVEFYLKDFGSSFYRVALCYDCPGRLECPKCNKTGYVTEVYQPYLVGLCYVKQAPEPHNPDGTEAAASAPAPAPPPAARRARSKRWSWSIPVAALATVVMAISIGLRFMYESETKPPPEPVQAVAEPESPPVAPPLAVVPPAPVPPPSAPASATVESDEPEKKPALAEVRPRKPAPPPVAAPSKPPAAANPAESKNPAVVRLQTALTQLELYHGPVNGEFDGPTHQALARLVAMVPASVKAQYGPRSAALAEAAVKHEFPLKR